MRFTSTVLDAISNKAAQPSLHRVSGEPGHYRLSQEPINPPAVHAAPNIHGVHNPPTANSVAQRPPNVELLIANLQREFPQTHVRITGSGRTVHRQAQLMAQRRRLNRTQFLSTYRAAPHITEMDTWVTAHPHANEAQVVAAFEEIINRARQTGAVVSNQ